MRGFVEHFIIHFPLKCSDMTLHKGSHGFTCHQTRATEHHCITAIWRVLIVPTHGAMTWVADWLLTKINFPLEPRYSYPSLY